MTSQTESTSSTRPSLRTPRALTSTFDQARARLPEVLKSEGFGILTEIDIQRTLKEKLNADFRRYVIFGACNPPLAHAALQADLSVGAMLPCNVVLYEDDRGLATVFAVDPLESIAGHGKPALKQVALTVSDKLERALLALT